MTEKRQQMISAMKYILLVIIVGYLVILMLYASGSKRTFFRSIKGCEQCIGQ